MPEMEPFMKHVEKSTKTDRENLFNDDSKADDNNRSVENVAGESRHFNGAFSDGSMVVLSGRHYEKGESFGIVYVPRQEDHKALPIQIALKQAWFNLGRGALAQTGILQRHEGLLEDYSVLSETHNECLNTLEEELEGKKSELQTFEKESAEWGKERENMLSGRGRVKCRSLIVSNVNPPPTSNRPVLSAALRSRIDQELHDLQLISAFVDSRLESIEQFLNNFANQPNETDLSNLESDDESVDTPLVSPFPHSDNDFQMTVNFLMN
nr:hypothetical protein [Tanacetum cinerariifolium]